MANFAPALQHRCASSIKLRFFASPGLDTALETLQDTALVEPAVRHWLSVSAWLLQQAVAR